MSINPITGLPEFGFFKKAFKKIKKVGRKVASVAQFVPGPWQAPAALIAKAGTVYDVAKGRASPLQLLTLGKGTGGLESLGGGKVGDFLGNVFGRTPGINPTAETGILGGTLGPRLRRGASDFLSGLFGGMGAGQQDEFTPIMDQNGNVIGYRNENTMQDISVDQYNQMMGQQGSFFGQKTPDFIKGIEDTLKGQTGPTSKGLFGGGGSGFGGGLASAGLGGFLGKLAYDAAKDRAGGLAVTPQVSMDSLGRYQLATDLGTGGTRGEFGLAPKPAVLNVAGGGEIQRQPFAVGGVAELDLREGGESIGPGTGTSDDIPAMLSDGEFVMTAKATRGAGAYDLKKGKSGIELVQGGDPSREKGVENMRELMNIFEGM
jgi:hypothetical protein